MIKICSPQLGLSSYSSLGGEVYDYQTIKGFCKKEIQVFVYLPKGRFFDKSIKNLFISFCFLRHIVPPISYSFFCLPYLFQTYNQEKFDILRIHIPRFLGLAGLIFHFFYPKVPIMVSAVNVENSGIYFNIEKKIYQIASIIIVQSEHMEKFLINKYGVDKNKIKITYGGVLDGVKSFSKKPIESKKIKPDDQVLLFMGVLTDRKNPLYVLEVFAKVFKNVKNLKLVIIGDGPEKSKLVDCIREEKLEKSVILISEAYGEEKMYWFSRMDIFLCPSKNEGFGLVATEAMTFGKPVIASDRAAFKEIITSGLDGFALPLEDQGLWVETVKSLLNNPIKSKKIGKKGRQKVEKRFSWERMYDLNLKVVRDILR